MIKVSFVVIGYNIAEYIDKCLNSILSQSLNDIEIIFVNDGSTDNTLAIVSEIAKVDNRIIIVNQSNRGANSARKSGFLKAKGEYIVFVDGDDWIELALAEHMYKLGVKGSYDIIAFGHYIAFEDKREKAHVNDIGVLTEYGYLENIMNYNLSHNLWNKFFNRKFLIETKFNDIPEITMGDDLAANIRMGIYKPNALVVKECYYNYYQNINSVTRKISPKVLEIETTIKDIETVLKENMLYRKYHKLVDYIKFRNFYSRVVKSVHKDCEIRRILYSNWKKARINIRKNEYCMTFVNTRPFLEIVLMYFYNYNYRIGYIVSRIYIRLIKKKLG